jgi:hypothetical protein
VVVVTIVTAVRRGSLRLSFMEVKRGLSWFGSVPWALDVQF